MQKQNNLSMVEITLYSLFGIIVLAIIIALIWTKLIKKNTFSHVSYNYFQTPNGRKMFLKLIKKSTLKKIYTKVTFHIQNISIQSISDIYIGNNYIYLISSPLTKNIKDVKNENGSFLTISKKNVKLNIHPEIEFFNNACKDFIKIFKLKNNVKIIIPASNKAFNTMNTENLTFVSTNKLEEVIQKFESEESTPLLEDKLKQLEKSITTKNRRFFIKIRSVYE